MIWGATATAPQNTSRLGLCAATSPVALQWSQAEIGQHAGAPQSVVGPLGEGSVESFPHGTQLRDNFGGQPNRRRSQLPRHKIVEGRLEPPGNGANQFGHVNPQNGLPCSRDTDTKNLSGSPLNSADSTLALRFLAVSMNSSTRPASSETTRSNAPAPSETADSS
jgi:hypothetical protein